MKKRIVKKLYGWFIRPRLVKKVKDTSNKIDDGMLRIFDMIIKEW